MSTLEFDRRRSTTVDGMAISLFISCRLNPAKRKASQFHWLIEWGAVSDSDLLKNSLLYREFQAEREEILKHECIESKKVGHDIGYEQALTDWIIKHRSQWRKSHTMAVVGQSQS
jgi:hypothetical protein